MSRKYVPSFIKSETTNSVAVNSVTEDNDNTPRFPTRNVNKFAVLDETTNKPLTMAQATQIKSDNVFNNNKKKSYADKFKTDQKPFNNKPVTQSTPIVVTADINSHDDFPSLGGLGSKSKNTPVTSGISSGPSRFSELAKNWAEKAKEEEERARIQKELEEQRKADDVKFREGVKIFGNGFGKKKVYTFEEDHESDKEYDEKYIGGADEEYEVPSHEESEPSDDEMNEFEDEYAGEQVNDDEFR